VRHSTIASRLSARSSQVTAGALVAGLMAVGVATAAPAAAVVAAPFHTAKGSSSTTMKKDLHKLRVCESGDNYRENTGNGYYGAYQFAPRTWTALGFAGRPDKAKDATQNRAARKLHREAGWSAWPSCSASEHLR
jgi:hypothetical protein